MLLLGDPLQLPQVAQASHPGSSGRSALEHLLGDDTTMPSDRGVFITETRRMHPDVCRFISDNVYEKTCATWRWPITSTAKSRDAPPTSRCHRTYAVEAALPLAAAAAARRGHTLRGQSVPVVHDAEVLGDTSGLSNGGTEAVNMLIEKARRLAHGYRNFGNYRLRMLLAASGTRTRRLRHATP